jgi:hypothetical protein
MPLTSKRDDRASGAPSPPRALRSSPERVPAGHALPSAGIEPDAQVATWVNPKAYIAWSTDSPVKLTMMYSEPVIQI